MSAPPPAESPSSAGRRLPGALAPLNAPVYRMLWFTWAAANLTMWMNDVAAAWLMTTLTTSPVMVAMVQAASTLPVFLLGLPSGALADILDRRRYYAATQAWVAAVAAVLALLALSGGLTAPLLLALTFANGIGLALRWPVFSAIVPAIVPRSELPSALALNGVSMNLARLVGPIVAGALIAAWGSAAVFLLNALLAIASCWLILRWRNTTQQASALPGERFVGAMRVGLQHVLQSPRMRVVLARTFSFFLQTSALTALLPLVALRVHGGGPGTFTVMLSSIGAGAITAALCFPWLRARYGRDTFVRVGGLLHAGLSLVVVLAPSLWIALPALAILGAAWISTANTLAVSAQMALPDWVRARGMSIYQVALMGGVAIGAMLWGKVASLSSVPVAVAVAAGLGALWQLATWRWTVEGEAEEDHRPAPSPNTGLAEPAFEIGADEGPVMVTIEYLIDPARAADFATVMQATRQARLRQGVLSWGLFRDTTHPGRYVEYFVDESWTEHQRRLARFTAADAGLREQRLAFHTGTEPPRVQRYLADQAMR